MAFDLGSSPVNSILQAASARVGVPFPLASAMAGQESAYGQASPNLFQITASTAANPGYGVAPISQQDIQDPYKNALFGLSYLKNRSAANGQDVNDPSQWASLLPNYNGTGSGAGDPSYAQHVLSRLGMSAGGSSGSSGFGAASNLPNVGFDPSVQSQQLPAMPSDFGTQDQPNAPAATVDTTGHQGDPLVAFGTALMGGNGWHDGIAKAGAAYADAQALQQRNNQLDATLQNDADNRDAEAPDRAAQAATLRAQAWKALNPVVSPDQALDANIQLRGQDVQQRGQDVQLQDALARQQYMAALTQGQPQQFVVSGDDGSPKAIIEAQKNKLGQLSYTNTSTGQTGNTLPDVGGAGAVPAAVYNPEAQRAFAMDKMGTKDVSTILQQGMAADNNNQAITNELAALGKPGALTGPGLSARIGRLIDSTAGTSIFGNLGDEQAAQMLAGQGNWQSIRSAISGAGRLTNMDVNLLRQNAPNIGTDPNAARQILGTLQRANTRQSQIASSWNSLAPVLQRSIIRSPDGVQQWEFAQNQKLLAQDPAQQTQQQQQATAGSTPPTNPQAGGGAALPPLSSFER